MGPNDAAKVALFRATAGIWANVRGRIVRPGLDAILFLPERPYLPPGTLRDVLVRTGQEGVIGDAQIATLVHVLGLLWERSITYLTLGDGGDGLGDYDAVLELAGDGGWSWKSVEAGREGVDKSAERS